VLCHVASLVPVSRTLGQQQQPRQADEGGMQDAEWPRARCAGGEITLRVALYGNYTALLSSSPPDLDCTQSISFPVFSVCL